MLEQKGIEVPIKKFLESDLVIEIFDNPTKLEFKDDRIIVLNKCDQVNREKFKFKTAINISAKSGDGIDNLLEVILFKGEAKLLYIILLQSQLKHDIS